MLHLSIARAIASDIRTVVQFLEQNQFIRQSCRRSMSALRGQFKNVRFSQQKKLLFVSDPKLTIRRAGRAHRLGFECIA